VAQRLVRRVCRHCKEEYQPEKELLVQLGLDVKKYPDAKFFRGEGCGHCNGTGYQGRVALYEVMEMNEPLSKLVIQGLSSSDLKQEARKHGMLTLRDSGVRKAMAGLTTIEEVLAATFED
jgi:type IV pilus assembly protein PilB